MRKRIGVKRGKIFWASVVFAVLTVSLLVACGGGGKEGGGSGGGIYDFWGLTHSITCSDPYKVTWAKNNWQMGYGGKPFIHAYHHPKKAGVVKLKVDVCQNSDPAMCKTTYCTTGGSEGQVYANAKAAGFKFGEPSLPPGEASKDFHEISAAEVTYIPGHFAAEDYYWDDLAENTGCGQRYNVNYGVNWEPDFGGAAFGHSFDYPKNPDMQKIKVDVCKDNGAGGQVCKTVDCTWGSDWKEAFRAMEAKGYRFEYPHRPRTEPSKGFRTRAAGRLTKAPDRVVLETGGGF